MPGKSTTITIVVKVDSQAEPKPRGKQKGSKDAPVRILSLEEKRLLERQGKRGWGVQSLSWKSGKGLYERKATSDI